MKPFVRVTEFWIPSPDRSELVFGGGLYGPLTEFRAVSEGTRFAYGEGLPGRAWADRRPIILKQLTGSYFRRGEMADAAGLSCGVAVPIFAGDFVLAVAVFFCGGDYDHVGAIEVWMNEPAKSGQMNFVDGYYGTAELFERESGRSFGKGHGLPGQTWAAGAPIFLPEVHRATRLLRREDGLQIGVNTGIGIPLMHDAERSWVITFLSASGTPIARRFEVWHAAPDRSHLTLSPNAATSAHKVTTQSRADSVLGRILLTGLPVTSSTLDTDAPLTADTIAAQSLTSMVALPVLDRAGRVAAVAAWYN